MRDRMKIIFELSKMTVADYIEIEEGTNSMKFTRGYLAKYMVDEDGNRLSHEEAFEMLNILTITEMRQAIAMFKETLEGLKKAALPPLQ